MSPVNPMGPPNHGAPLSAPGDVITKSYLDQLVSGGSDMSSTLTLPEVEDLKKRMTLMEARLNGLVDAIALNHVGHPVGGHSDACWSCKILDSEKGLKVANRLMEDSGVPQ